MGIQGFAARVSRARDVAALAACVLDDTGDLADAPWRGLYFFLPDRIDIHVRGVPGAFLERYERYGRASDPVLEGVSRSHAPCQTSSGELYAFSRDPRLPDAFRELIDGALAGGRRAQYLAAPVVVDGELAGTICLARPVDEAFSPPQVMTAFAMALHVSCRLAALRALSSDLGYAWQDVLTPRGRAVAELAARGLTTHEIGRALDVSANTAKKHLRIAYERLGISTRAELAGTLARGRVP